MENCNPSTPAAAGPQHYGSRVRDTPTVGGMLFVNPCTWGHIVEEAARIPNLLGEELLTPKELAGLEDRVSPDGIII